MVRIANTNIIVDQFSTARSNRANKYVHFLTHIHTDHLKGLSNTWDCGTIYCSKITKQLILLKFPNLHKCLKQLPYETQNQIKLSDELEITVTIFDSNHCAGSVMILFQGYMGNILYTGDLRFDKTIFQKFTYLYPHHKRNSQFDNCSIPIDYLYLDVTFLHPKYTFPSRKTAVDILDKFIQTTMENAKKENKFIQFFIGIDKYGKEEVLIHLAQKFNTYISVSQERYRNMSRIDLDSQLFSTDRKSGFIHVVLKRQLKKYITEKEKNIGILLTGWANQTQFLCNNKCLAIPYSLHSSYSELIDFVKSLRPTFIESIIQDKRSLINSPSQRQSDDSSLNLYQNIDYEEHLNIIRSDFCSPPSQQIEMLINNIDLQKTIEIKLKLNRTAEQNLKDKQESNLLLFNKERGLQNLKKGNMCKFTVPRDQQEIKRVKQKLKNFKQDCRVKVHPYVSVRKQQINSAKNGEVVFIDIDRLPQRILQGSDSTNSSSHKIHRIFKKLDTNSVDNDTEVMNILEERMFRAQPKDLDPLSRRIQNNKKIVFQKNELKTPQSKSLQQPQTCSSISHDSLRSSPFDLLSSFLSEGSIKPSGFKTITSNTQKQIKIPSFDQLNKIKQVVVNYTRIQ